MYKWPTVAHSRHVRILKIFIGKRLSKNKINKKRIKKIDFLHCHHNTTTGVITYNREKHTVMISCIIIIGKYILRASVTQSLNRALYHGSRRVMLVI